MCGIVIGNQFAFKIYVVLEWLIIDSSSDAYFLLKLYKRMLDDDIQRRKEMEYNTNAKFECAGFGLLFQTSGIY